MGHKLEILARQKGFLDSRATQLQGTTVCLLWRGAEPEAQLCSAALTLTRHRVPAAMHMPVMSGFHGTQGGNYRV